MPQGELLDVISQLMNSSYTEKDVLIMFRQVVEAVDHCHRNNVVHCDIKVYLLVTYVTFFLHAKTRPQLNISSHKLTFLPPMLFLSVGKSLLQI